jgi:hypothetical protein
MSPIEKETKLVLTQEDYERLLAAGPVLERTEQLNVYLHDPVRVGERGETFRVRFEAGKEAVATLKIPAGWRGAMREMVEVERPLAELGPGFFPWPKRWIQLDARVPEGFVEHFQGMGVTRLRRLGWMRNLRCLVELGPDGTVEVDRTVLPGGEVVFEVEIEHPVEETHKRLVERVRRLAPGAEFSRIGKFSRFLAAAGFAPPSDSAHTRV